MVYSYLDTLVAELGCWNRALSPIPKILSLGPFAKLTNPSLEQNEGRWSPLPIPTAAAMDSPSCTPAPR